MGYERGYRCPDYRKLCFVPTHRSDQSVGLKPEERSQRQKHVRSLGPLGPDLCLLYSAALLDASMIDLDSPSHRLELIPFLRVHLRVVGGPVLDLSISFPYGPEHLDRAVVLEQDDPSLL